jgi:CheY-like chemotaxis protein
VRWCGRSAICRIPDLKAARAISRCGFVLSVSPSPAETILEEVPRPKLSLGNLIECNQKRSLAAVCVSDPTPPRVKTVLLVDDGDESRLATKWFLTYFGYVVDSVCSAEEALGVFDPKIHDAVLTDNSMPGMTGVEMAHIIKLRSPSTPVLMHTGLAPEDRSCLDLVMLKPVHLLEIKDALDQLLARVPPPK